MATVNRKVIDISHWNTVTSWSAIKAAGVTGVIAKATQGSAIKDASYLVNCAPAYRAGMLWGAYHFADNSDVPTQVNNFLSTVGVDNDTLYALDWEDYAGGTMTLTQAQQWIELVEAKIGANRVVIYSGNTAKEALGTAVNIFFGAHRLWLADWSSNPVTQASWASYWLWQYSDGVNGPGPYGCPGVSGSVDTSSWAGTDAGLAAAWVGGVAPTPVPVPTIPTVTITTNGAVQVMVNGQIIQPLSSRVD